MLTKFATLLAASAVLLASSASAAPLPTGAWPVSKGLVQKDKPIPVKKGEVYDGKMQTFERSNIKCKGQDETGPETAVFLLEPGATLKNVIIGVNQAEGVHCDEGGCTLENVWWADVCEDALSVKGGSDASVTRVMGGGARYADDKIIQHNGKGTVVIDGFYAQDFGKVYRSCGNCGNKPRKVQMSNVLAVRPKSGILAVNQNFGDQATLRNIHIRATSSKAVPVCMWSQGVSSGEPKITDDGPLPPLCNYSPSDIHQTTIKLRRD